MRHAKSSWDDASIPDFDRPLNVRGEAAAPFIGALMLEKRYIPDRIISSPAKRASRTAELVAAEIRNAAAVTFDERIYEAGVMELLAVIGGLPDSLGSAMIVGHNPGMESLILHLTGSLIPMPTAAFAVLDLNVSRWADVRGNCGIVADLLRHKKATYSSIRPSTFNRR